MPSSPPHTLDSFDSAEPVLRPGRAEVLAIALVVTFAARAIPDWAFFPWMWDRVLGPRTPWWDAVLSRLPLLAMGLVLALPNRRRSGLRVGRIRAHWRGVLVVCGIPVLATALVYPFLPVRPFAGAGAEMWLLSPLAQDLVFSGFLYGILEPVFPAYVDPRVPVRRALLVGAACFSLWHLPNVWAFPAGFVAFQMAYTAAGFVVAGLSRQWTGSILYVTLAHSAVNLIAWLTS